MKRGAGAPRRRRRLVLAALFLAAVARAGETEPPFRYVWGEAFHVMPETHSDESGYFSLCEGLDGKIYVGTAKYNENAYLVEFDPATGGQRIAIDTHELCGVTATGYAAQAKIHTRNFVGPSGKIYVGSKQGYRLRGDASEYPGGYLMTYDPATGVAENLGMPYPKEGVIDVVADEGRGLVYVVTCEEQHWMLYDVRVRDTRTRSFRELGPRLTPYATTLVDRRGRANAVTRDFRLARYDPERDRITLHDITVDGARWSRTNESAIPTWQLAADGRTAYLILMNDPTLLEMRLDGKVIRARSRGRMVEGGNPDSRCALSIAPYGRVYAVVRVDNDTGFGSGYLHHLARYDPERKKTRAMEDLGVLAVSNPDFFDFGPGPDGRKPPWSHGYHRLPDGTLTPLHHHMALVVGRDGTIWVTIICPFTLLRIDASRTAEEGE